MIKGERSGSREGEAAFMSTLIIKEFKISVEQDRVVTTLNQTLDIIFSVVHLE